MKNFFLIFFISILGGTALFSQSIYFNDNNNFYFDSYIFNNSLGYNPPITFSDNLSYDFLNKRYNLNYSINNYNFTLPKSISFIDYLDFRFQNDNHEYWRKKSSRLDSYTNVDINNPLGFNIENRAFDKVFGGNIVDVRPQGSSELIFSLKFNKLENPALPIEQQRNTTFDFEEKIQMSVIGNIGDKLRITTNYNTESTFDFENNIKLEYTGYEDDIIKKIEVGNVNLPLTGTLINGSQSLFGLKTQFQFGRATVTNILTQQKSDVKIIDVAGGAQTTDFDIVADDYDANRHFFISKYFRDNYNYFLSQLPFINSPISITKMEVWITNKTGVTEGTRNIIGFSDIGEPLSYVSNQNFVFQNTDTVLIYTPSNHANSLYNDLSVNYFGIRDINQINSILGPLSSDSSFVASIDYEKLERSRLLSESEYTYHPKLGYISLNQSLNADEVLAVAYQYTIGNDVYQVGEFASNNDAPNALFVKLLKNTNFTPKSSLWDLMMKNIYSLGSYQLSSDDFVLDIYYENTNENGALVNYLPEESDLSVNGIPLLRLLNLDNLNSQQDNQFDGVFDFIEGVTIIPSKGRIIFPVVEPFGDYLRGKFNVTTNQDIIDSYIYDPLYDNTVTIAQQYPELNKYKLIGSYKSETGSEIYLNAMQIPQGSVTVTSGGIKLVENQDYTVDYNFGKVTIINESILMAGTPISISLESNALFGSQFKTLLGSHIDYEISEDLSIGGTILNLTERPLTQKVNTGEEPISNTIWGLDLTYNTKVPLLTKLVDKLPLISTKEKSTFTNVTEFAHLIPGHQKSIGESGTAYIDDFEASRIGIEIKNPGAWYLSSTPTDPDLLIGNILGDYSLQTNFFRSKISWYTIDPLFYRSNSITPDHIKDDLEQLSNHFVREVLEKEVFPNKDPDIGSQITNLATLDIAFYPDKRGPYNFNYSNFDEYGNLKNPKNNWGGITRKLETNDFEAANVEFIEFWLMDPFNDDDISDRDINGGYLYFNLGNISEDVLKDGWKSFENGLPTSTSVENVDTTIWGRVPTTYSIVNAFDNDPAAREFQDVGLDGLGDNDELLFYSDFTQSVSDNFGVNSIIYSQVLEDPSGDNYHYFRGDDFDNEEKNILGRYENYNGLEGNSALPDPDPTASTTLPNTEDINRDNTLNETESFFQYKVHLHPNMDVGQSYITDKLTSVAQTPDGDREIVWYQFKIPIQQPDKVVGSIEDFKSIRFIRMFLNDFSQQAVLRFATLELVKGEWRRYTFDLNEPGEYISVDNNDNTIFDISAVNVEENGDRIPVNYITPPDIEQEIDNTTTALRRMNEQSLVLKVCDLKDGESRAAYKTSSFDLRSYQKLKMYVHAEAVNDELSLSNGDVSVFIRLGSDFTDNYYEYELPLLVTPWYTNNVLEVWPEENELEILFDDLLNAKKARNIEVNQGNHSYNHPFVINSGLGEITVIGNPNLSNVKTIMIGVRNPKKTSVNVDDGLDKCAEVWVNELRLTDFDEYGGVAVNSRINLRVADLANINISGGFSTIGFGSIEKKVNERQRFNSMQYDASSIVSLDKFLPKASGFKIPFYFGLSENIQTPQYNPLDPDILLKPTLQSLNSTDRDSLRVIVQDYTKRKSINLTNVRKVKKVGDNTKSKDNFYDLENFSVTYAYNETFNSDLNREYSIEKNYRGILSYNFTSRPVSVTPFKKIKLFKSKYFRLIKDFNFYLSPRSVSFNTDIYRSFNTVKIRNISNPNMLIEPTFDKSFIWNRNFSIKYDISRNLKVDFSTNNQASIDEPYGNIDTEEEKDIIFENLLNFGRPVNYNHTLSVNYNLPINKFPVTDWITLNTRYIANYSWNGAPLSLQASDINLGNTIQNSSNKQINGQFNLNSLYNKIPYLKKLNQQSRPQRNIRGVGRENNVIQDTIQKSFKIKDHFLRLLFSPKNLSFSYTSNEGTLLPGYLPDPSWLGMDYSIMKPGFGFIFGSQNDITPDYHDPKDIPWISTNPNLNALYTNTSTETINLRGTLEPFKGFRIEFTGNRNFTQNMQETFRYDTTDNFYHHYNPIANGSFSISYLCFKTSFLKNQDEYISQAFEEFKSNRIIVAERLAALNPNTNTIDSTGFPIGYGSSYQEVLIPAFLSAYSGTQVNDISLNLFPAIPLPNWRINYNGLSKIKFLKKHFKSINLMHTYRCTYSLNSFSTNLDYTETNDFPSNINNNTNNFYPKYEISQITISENFTPLFKLDMTLENSLLIKFEFKKDRILSLSLANSQLTEIKSKELIFGTGYRIKDLNFNFFSAGRTKGVSSDLDIKLDFSIRDNKTIVREIQEDVNLITMGQRVFSLKGSTDYVVNDRLNIRFFIDKVLTNPYVSNTFPGATTNIGFSIRFTLAQ